jgi:hypothetical protein
MKADTLHEVYATYKAIDDSLHVTKRIVESSNQSIRALHKGTLFWGKRATEFEPQMVSIVAEFNDIMVLALFAAFERGLRISVQNMLNVNLHTQNQTVLRFAELTNESVERWIMTDMLFALRDIVDGATRGQVKQVYEYRNWVAHGKNPGRVPAANASPAPVYALLSRFITQASAVL